jgi:hypothetical protein
MNARERRHAKRRTERAREALRTAVRDASTVGLGIESVYDTRQEARKLRKPLQAYRNLAAKSGINSRMCSGKQSRSK